MSEFKGQFTCEEIHAMRQAAAECAQRLGVEGDGEKERDIAMAMLSAAGAGTLKPDELIAAGIAAINGASSNEGEDSPGA